ncbi:hypothetical protein DUI87_14300 [Hirundo rustica rustica]|uniref:Uncharacterized protein n=1 Tax=Hirundo rustica rustica TaxID=333673 RepID=A0A3M0K873_HIRRU|nr:hypothetical protein DUI87_14300 [Hirundo rustica rustica]
MRMARRSPLGFVLNTPTWEAQNASGATLLRLPLSLRKILTPRYQKETSRGQKETDEGFISASSTAAT